MKKFLVTYHASAESMAVMATATLEQQAQGLKMWTDWFQQLGDKVIDMGAPLLSGQTLATNGNYAPSTKQLTGYTIIQATDMEEAKALVASNPHTSGWNSEATVEIHEAMTIPGM